MFKEQGSLFTTKGFVISILNINKSSPAESEEHGDGVADADVGVPVREVLPVEVVDVRVDDVRGPAAEEDDGDGGHQDVRLPPPGVGRLVLGLGPARKQKQMFVWLYFSNVFLLRRF